MFLSKIRRKITKGVRLKSQILSKFQPKTQILSKFLPYLVYIFGRFPIQSTEEAASAIAAFMEVNDAGNEFEGSNGWMLLTSLKVRG